MFIGGNDMRDGIISALTTPTFNPAAFVDARLGDARGHADRTLRTWRADFAVLNLPISGAPRAAAAGVPLAAS